MRLIVLSIICFYLSLHNAQGQLIKKQLYSHARQQRPTSIIWSFKENGDFSAILFWANKEKFGFSANKGTYTVDDSTKTMQVKFDSTYNVYSKDSFSVTKDIGFQEWQLILINDYKIVVCRPPVWEFEKKSIADNDKRLTVTLDSSKRNKRDRKFKQVHSMNPLEKSK